ncbi:MAG: hypothetical protein GDA50_03365 [Alphaproteobacteria bacterium GM202ARS2]|nr:hypothetical protein [Alphaproteobacteria bacterium GM202ARS2]
MFSIFRILALATVSFFVIRWLGIPLWGPLFDNPISCWFSVVILLLFGLQFPVALIFAFIDYYSVIDNLLSPGVRLPFDWNNKLLKAYDGFLRIYNFILRILPVLLTTIGILGTFYGIFIGLLKFDSKAVGDSVPALLEGLKIAFGTSILGLLTGLLSKMFSPFIAPEIEEGGVGAEEIHQAIKEQTRTFKGFMQKMAKNNADALIEALQKVMDDFNQKINDQLGDNFKALSEAIKQLVVWQENYKEQMDSMQQQLQAAIDGMQEARQAIDGSAQSLKSVEEATKTIPENIKSLADIVQTITGSLEAFAELRDKAVEVMPMLKENMDALTQGLADHVQSINTQLEQNLTTLRDEFSDQMQAMTRKLGDSQEEWIEGIRSEVSGVTGAITENMGQLTRELSTHVESINTQLTENLESLGDEFSKQMQAMTQKLNESQETWARGLHGEVEEATKTIADHLGRIAEKTAKDYEKFHAVLQQFHQLLPALMDKPK